jgi:hypothetical protein
LHLSDAEQYRRLNDAVCVCVGEVRAPTEPEQPEPDLVLDIAELIWEPIADLPLRRLSRLIQPSGDIRERWCSLRSGT